MKISKAFPQSLLGKELPLVDGKTSIFEAISLLVSNNVGVLPVRSTKTTIPERAKRDGGSASSSLSSFAISGYSIISRLNEKKSESLPGYLEGPCEESTLTLGSIKMEEDLISLLQVFESSTFGSAIVEGGRTIVTIRDFLKLFVDGKLSTNLTSGDVSSSPVFSMDPTAKLQDYLKESIRRKFRRVQLDGKTNIVSDKNVLSYILEKREEVKKNPAKFLEAPLDSLSHESTPVVESNSNIELAAKTLMTKNVGAAFTDRGILTPWDLVVKPWRAGRLKMAD